MRKDGLFTLAACCAATAWAACGAAGDVATRAAAVDTLTASDTVISTASGRVARIADMAVAADGRLYLLDVQLHQLLSVRPDGTEPRTLGREGAGPGEFSRPSAVAVARDTVRVYDRGNGRVQVFDPEGAFVRSYPIAMDELGGGAALDGRGRLTLATGGQDSTLVAVFDAAGSRTNAFGTPVVPPTRFFDLASIKDRIRSGRIPDEFRNNALPAWGEDGSLWLAFYSEPELRRYDAAGALLWSRPLAGPVLESARAAFVRKNIEEKDPAAISLLRYVADAQEVDGRLWLLLNTEAVESGVVLVFDGDDGSLARRLVLPGLAGATRLAVDPRRARLYLDVADEAMVVAVALDPRGTGGERPSP